MPPDPRVIPTSMDGMSETVDLSASNSSIKATRKMPKE